MLTSACDCNKLAGAELLLCGDRRFNWTPRFIAFCRASNLQVRTLNGPSEPLNQTALAHMISQSALAFSLLGRLLCFGISAKRITDSNSLANKLNITASAATCRNNLTPNVSLCPLTMGFVKLMIINSKASCHVIALCGQRLHCYIKPPITFSNLILRRCCIALTVCVTRQNKYYHIRTT